MQVKKSPIDVPGTLRHVIGRGSGNMAMIFVFLRLNVIMLLRAPKKVPLIINVNLRRPGGEIDRPYFYAKMHGEVRDPLKV
jgi:hypothetical protein